MRGRPRRLLAAVATVLFSILCVLAASEIGLRIFKPLYTVGIDRAFVYDSEVGYRFKPNLTLRRTTDFLEEIRTNPLGVTGFQDDFGGYSTLVFCLGDSFTQGVGVPVDAAYPFQLDLLLNRDAEGKYIKRYGVVNLGVAGYGGEQSLLALRHYAALLGKPGIILYLGVENDYEDDLIFRSGSRRRHLVDGSPYWGRLLGPARWLFNTEIGKRAKWVGGELWRAEALPASAPGRQLSRAELEEPVLQRIAAASHEYGALLIVSWSPTPVPSTSAPSYRWLKAWSMRNSVPFADWMGVVESVRASIPVLPVDNPHSGNHWRVWVNQVMAAEFARQIRAHQR